MSGGRFDDYPAGAGKTGQPVVCHKLASLPGALWLGYGRDDRSENDGAESEAHGRQSDSRRRHVGFLVPATTVSSISRRQAGEQQTVWAATA